PQPGLCLPKCPSCTPTGTALLRRLSLRSCRHYQGVLFFLASIMPRKSMWVYLGGRCMVHTYSKIPAYPTCYVLRAKSKRQAMYAPKGLRLAMILLAAAANRRPFGAYIACL